MRSTDILWYIERKLHGTLLAWRNRQLNRRHGNPRSTGPWVTSRRQELHAALRCLVPVDKLDADVECDSFFIVDPERSVFLSSRTNP